MEKFIRLKLKTQFQMVIAVMFLFLTVNGVVIMLLMKNLVLQNIVSYTHISDRFTAYMENYFSKASYIFDVLQADDDVMLLLKEPYTAEMPLLLKKIDTTLQSLKIAIPEAADSVITYGNRTITSKIDYDTILTALEPMQHTGSAQSLGIYTTQWLHSLERNGQYAFLGKRLYVSGTPSYGTLLVVFDLHRSISDFMYQDGNTAGFMITDGQGERYTLNLTGAEADAIAQSCQKDNGFSLDKKRKPLEVAGFFLFPAYVPELDYHIVAALHNNVFQQSFLKTAAIMLLLLFIILLAGMSFVGGIFRNILKPVRILSNHLNAVRRSTITLNSQQLSLTGFKEMEEVSDSFNAMAETLEQMQHNLNNTIIKLYESKLAKRQAELSFLKSQINPHFLNNILQHIKDIAIMNRVEQIPEISDAMATLFNYKLYGANTASLQKEIEVTQAYLAIQTLRFPGKFTVAYHIPDQLRTVPIIKLVLQPIVENAIYHGLEPKTGAGLIYIGVREEDGIIFMTVQDDGIGIPEETLASIHARMHQSEMEEHAGGAEHIGLLNVHRRIRLAYGDRYGIDITSVSGEGTKVVISLPLRQTETEAYYETV